MTHTITTRLLAAGAGGALATAAVLVGVGAVQTSSFSSRAERDIRSLSDAQIDGITSGLYQTVATQGESVAADVAGGLNVISYLAKAAGGLRLGSDTVTWPAVNQFTQAATSVTLPRLELGGTWLGQNKQESVPTPLVDEVKSLTGVTATVFQRMNDKGDMLRVATNVIKNGSRAIGTYIPVTMADGTANAVLAKTLRGEIYHGSALVVSDWYQTAYQPIVGSDGGVIGMLFVGVKQQSVPALVSAINRTAVGSHGDVLVLGTTGTRAGQVFVARDSAAIGTSLLDVADAHGSRFVSQMVKAAGDLKEGAVGTIDYRDSVHGAMTARFAYYQPWDWLIVARAPLSDFEHPITVLHQGRSHMVVVLLVVGILAAMAGSVGVWWTSRRIVRPLRSMTTVAGALAGGDTSHLVEHHSQDELGRLADAFREMSDYQRDCAQLARQVEAGDVRARVVPASERDELRLALAGMVSQLGELVGAIQEAAGSVSASSERLDALSGTLATNVELTADRARDVSNSTGQLSSSIDEISGAITATSETARRALAAANKSVGSVERLRSASQEVGAVVRLIGDITARTDMLALNATIEASRAGAAGAGFAVVAGEVKALAGQTAEATRSISDRVSAIRAGTDEVHDAMGTIDAAISAVSGGAETTSAAVHEQAELSGSISRSMADVVIAAESSRTAAAEARSASADLASTANTLLDLVRRFH